MDSSLNAMAICESPQLLASVAAGPPLAVAAAGSSGASAATAPAGEAAESPTGLKRTASSPSCLGREVQEPDVASGLGLWSASPEKPKWLLADGRLLTARLEGENEALKRAVSRALLEIDELEARRARCDALSRTLAERNASAEQVSRVLLSAATGSPSQPVESKESSGGAGDVVGGAGSQQVAATPEAAESLRRLVLPIAASASRGAGREEPVTTATATPDMSQTQRVARDRLLETSLQVSRRMEEILARRGSKFQAALLGGSDAAARAVAGAAP